MTSRLIWCAHLPSWQTDTGAVDHMDFLIRALSQDHYPLDIIKVAELRLITLEDKRQALLACHREAERLQQRLDAVIEIERDLDTKREDTQ